MRAPILTARLAPLSDVAINRWCSRTPPIHAEKKADATKGGVLKEAVGKAGGSVKIQKLDGKFQEERTYPDSSDPPGSPG